MNPRLHDPTADDRLRAAYRRLLARAAVIAVLVHVAVLAFLVLPFGAPIQQIIGDDLILFDIPTDLPPPPEERARPAEPLIAEEPMAEDVTIAPTELTEEPPQPPPPDTKAIHPEGGALPFVSYTVRPRCTSRCGGEDVLGHLPPLVRKAGVACRVVVGLHVDLEGSVTEIRILQPSGVPACDQAVESWARTTRWTTAYNRDVPVAVWIAQPVELSTE